MINSIKRRAAEGLAWAAALSVTSKIIGIVSQVVLARFLYPEDFGLVAMANSLVTIVAVLQSGGVRTVLISRPHDLTSLKHSAFWLCMLQGLVASVIALCCMPLLAKCYNESRLYQLIPPMCLGLMIDSAAVVPTVMLQSELKFRFLGLANIGSPIINAGLAMLMAGCGAGVWSLVLPKIPTAILLCSILWWKSGMTLSKRCRLHDWWAIMRDSLMMTVAWISFAAAGQVPLFYLSRSHGVATIGVYSFAITITTQIVSIVANQFDSVLFPSLSRLSDDPEAQRDVFLKITLILAVAVTVLSGAQYLMAEPLLAIFFGRKWEAATPFVQYFSIGNAVLAAAIPTGGAMQARGKIKAYAIFGVASFFLSIVIVGAAFIFTNGVRGIILGVVVYQIVLSIVGWLIVSKIYEFPVGRLFRGLAPVFVASFVSVEVALYVTPAFIAITGQLVRILGFLSVFIAVWLLLMALIARNQLRFTISQLKNLRV